MAGCPWRGPVVGPPDRDAIDAGRVVQSVGIGLASAGDDLADILLKSGPPTLATRSRRSALFMAEVPGA